MSSLSLSAIYRYPIKSARGHPLQEARTDAFGIAGDRRWMLVDEHGVFVSQRTMAAMALLDVTPTHDGLLPGHGRARWQYQPCAGGFSQA